MKMDNIGLQRFEEAEEIPRRVGQVPAHIRSYGEAFCLHFFAERAKVGNRKDARVMALLPL
jgi:hypothetical protein